MLRSPTTRPAALGLIALACALGCTLGCSIARPPPPPINERAARPRPGPPAGVDTALSAAGSGDWEAAIVVDGGAPTVLTAGAPGAKITVPFGAHEIGVAVTTYHLVTTMVSQTTTTTETQTVACGAGSTTTVCTQTVSVPVTHMVPVTSRVADAHCDASVAFNAVFDEARAIAVDADPAHCAISDATPRADPFAPR